MLRDPVHRVVAILREECRRWEEPAVGRYRDPYLILVATVLSLRTKEETTGEASRRLFALARTPGGMIRLGPKAIARAIYPVGFYRTKARTIVSISRTIVDRFGGTVPRSLEELLLLKGVGRKTANLVLSLGFGIHAICVDTHVHRIANRWGYVDTKTPEETEDALRGRLPRRHWTVLNGLLVIYGRNVCRPLSPLCSRCRIRFFCRRVGVRRSR